MILFRTHRTTIPALCLGTLLVGTGCGPTKVTTDPSPGLEQHQVTSVVVVPFQRLTTPQVLDPTGPQFNVPRGAKRSDISLDVAPRAAEQPVQQTATVPSSVPQKVTEAVSAKLTERQGLRILSPDEATRVLNKLGDAIRDWPLERIGREVATQLQADAALVGKVLIYRERVGSRWGADSAAVGFEVTLVAADGSLLWSANYYEKQRPMNEDFVGFIQHGGVFVTADELVSYGAEKIARKFPYGGPTR